MSMIYSKQHKEKKFKWSLNLVFLLSLPFRNSPLILDPFSIPFSWYRFWIPCADLHFRATIFFILNGMNIAGLNWINTITTNLLKGGLNWLLNYVNSKHCYILACQSSCKTQWKNASHFMEDDHQKSTVKPSVKLNQLNQLLVTLNAENKIGHLT